MMRITSILTILCLVSMGFATNLYAEHPDGGHTEGHGGHKHHVALFVGNTHDHHGEDAFTVGLDYEYRLTDLFGVGALIDHATGDIESTVAGVGLFIHPLRQFRLLALAANEHKHGEDEFIVRLGVGYSIPVAGWSVEPIIDVDLLSGGEQNWVYGVAVGRGF